MNTHEHDLGANERSVLEAIRRLADMADPMDESDADDSDFEIGASKICGELGWAPTAARISMVTGLCATLLKLRLICRKQNGYFWPAPTSVHVVAPERAMTAIQALQANLCGPPPAPTVHKSAALQRLDAMKAKLERLKALRGGQ